MADKKFDVLVVGELNMDLIMNQLEKYPEIGRETIAGKMLLTLGSSSAIFASNLSVLGSRVSFCGRVGRDSFAEKILTDLSKKGVDTRYIIKSKSQDTGLTVVLNVGEDRAMITYPGAMNELTAEEVTDEMLSSARHLHVSSVFLQPALKPGLAMLFKRARNLGLTTSLDPQWDPAEQWEFDIENILSQLNVFLPNIEELKNITRQSSLEECLRQFKNKALAVVVKMGNSGAVLWYADDVTPQPAFLNENVVDAIGAGDSFNAGFIHRFVQERPAAACLEFGALCGAINTTAGGGTTAFSDYDAVKKIALDKFKFKV